MRVFLFAFLCSFPIARAASPAVTVLNPLENQLPTVARVNNHWSWAPSLDTFSSTDGNLEYTTSPLPRWMVFDSMRFAFTGIPSEVDEGAPEVIVTARGSSSSISSRVTFCVSKDVPPTPRLSIAAQFRSGNPSLSSVFLLSPGSGLATGNPILRVPSGWSFSIGFEPKTYVAVGNSSNIYYGIKQANGSRLPEWMTFNRQMLTLNGVAPSVNNLTTPTTFRLELHASIQEACSAASTRFDIVVASHELSVTASMPTVNVTAARPFNVSLNSPTDFAGVFVDANPIQSQNISDLAINVSGYESWLRYDPTSYSLIGNPQTEQGEHKPTLPVTIRTNFNQSINTNVSVALVPSYFTQEVFPMIYIPPRGKISFDLARYFSNSSFETRDDVDLSVTYEPINIETWFELSGRLWLKGTVPDGHSPANISVTFIAYSHITHSTSHASLPIRVITPETEDKRRGADHSSTRRAQLVLAFVITLAILGGLCVICGIFAIMRRVRKVDDTGCDGVEGRSIRSKRDRAWWWPDVVKPSDWGKWPGRFGASGSHISTSTPDQSGGIPELGLHRVQERSGKLDPNPNYSIASPNALSPATMNKREFFANLRKTVRCTSKKYSLKKTTGSGSSQERPILVQARSRTLEEEGLFFEESVANEHLANPECRIISHSSSSHEPTAGYSASQRRGDARLTPKTQIHRDRGQQDLRRVPRASTLSANSLTWSSGGSLSMEVVSPAPVFVRPRPDPLTVVNTLTDSSVSATSIAIDATDSSVTDSAFMDEQVASQKASIIKTLGLTRAADDVKESNSEDELRMGLHYVQALGGDNEREGAICPVISPNTGSLFSSSGSYSNTGRGTGSSYLSAKRVIVISGEEFDFFVRLLPVSNDIRAQGAGTSAQEVVRHEYSVKIISGRTLSRLHVDLNEVETRGIAKITGESTRDDIGIVALGIYTGQNDETCLAVIIIEVAETR